tara:strand:+ start:9027 stop:9620 length:594 start_codon:yes stop_codon:yes gene_type:complete
MKINLKFILFIFLVSIIIKITLSYIDKRILSKNEIEGFTSGQCPSMMIKQADQILLYNPNYMKIPGVNPIVLKNLKEYEEYLKWQKANKLNCPILHLEQMYDTQGLEQYEIKQSFKSNTPVGPLNHDIPIIHKTPDINNILQESNNSMYNSKFNSPYDPYNQDIGVYTGKDKLDVLDPYSYNKKKDNKEVKFNRTLY